MKFTFFAVTILTITFSVSYSQDLRDFTYGPTTSFGTPGEDRLYGIALSFDGSIFGYGHTHPSGGDALKQGLLVKWNSDLTVAWSRKYHFDRAFVNGREVKTLSDGTPILVSNIGTSGQHHTMITAVDSENGDEIWSFDFASVIGDGSKHMLSHAIAISEFDEIYVSGSIQNLDVLGSAHNAYLARLNSNGEFVWIRYLNGPAYIANNGLSITPSGNVLVVGSTLSPLFNQNSNGNYDVYLAEYEPDGELLRGRMIGTTSNEYGLDVANYGKTIFITGSWQRSLTGLNISLVRLDDFNAEPEITYIASTRSDARGLRIVALSDSKAVITGWVSGNIVGWSGPSGINTCVLIETNLGDVVNVLSTSGNNGYCYSVDVFSDGTNIIHGGYIYNNNYDFFLHKAIPFDPVSVEENVSPTAFNILPNYPNPFNPTTQLRFEVGQPENVGIRIFSMAGQLVQEVPSTMYSSGSHSISVDGSTWASGIYLVDFITEKGRFLSKMTLVK
jgi:outer membrane protein assembly factor BamB